MHQRDVPFLEAVDEDVEEGAEVVAAGSLIEFELGERREHNIAHKSLFFALFNVTFGLTVYELRHVAEVYEVDVHFGEDVTATLKQF